MLSPMRIGIVGHGSDKFTPLGRRRAIKAIRILLLPLSQSPDDHTLVSGHSPLGGIDIWAENIANSLHIPTDLKIPQINQWNPPGGYGFRQRNLDIAHDSDVVYVIVVTEYPTNYPGQRFNYCYHCNSTDHIKSGGCWTGHKAESSVWLPISNY